jgi:hypothetical protein
MARQVTNRFSIKLPDRQCTQTGGQTLKVLFRFHFPNSTLNDDSNDGQGRQNMDVRKCTMNRGDWNLARNVINKSINQSKLDR